MTLDQLSNAQTAEFELFYLNFVFESVEDEATFMQNPTVTPEERKRIRHQHQIPHEEIAMYFRKKSVDNKTLRNIVIAYWLRKHRVLKARGDLQLANFSARFLREFMDTQEFQRGLAMEKYQKVEVIE